MKKYMELLVAIIINVLTVFPLNAQKDTIFLDSDNFTVVEDSLCLVRLKLGSDTLISRIIQSPDAIISFSIGSKLFIAKGKHPFFAASDPSNCNAYFYTYFGKNVSIQNDVLTLHTCFVVDPEINKNPKKYKHSIRKH